MAEVIETWLNQAIQIKSEYERIRKAHRENVKMVQSKCRKSNGHVWGEMFGPPMRYNGPPTRKKICLCCGFCERTSEVTNAKSVMQALYTNVALPPEKEVIREIARELYSPEKMEELEFLEERFKQTQKQVREIREICNFFLGETSKSVIMTNQDDEVDCFD